MDQIEYEKQRLKQKHSLKRSENSDYEANPKNYYSKVFTKILIGAIFVLASAIYINFGEEFRTTYKKIVFEDNLSFTTMNQLYQKYFGELLPLDIQNPSQMVGKEKNNFLNMEKYLDGQKVSVSQNSIIQALNSGIVVYIGPKDNYENVVIVQGIDGVDIWYGNIDNTSMSLYDYIDKNSIIGNAKSDYIYLLFNKDGQYLEYDQYMETL